jgi:hypothetical protein
MEMLQVSKDFVLEAYAAACPTWKKKLEKQFPLLIPQLMKDMITKMPSYQNFYGKCLGNPLSFMNGKIYLDVPTSREGLFLAWDFARAFLTAYTDYVLEMQPNQFIFIRQ